MQKRSVLSALCAALACAALLSGCERQAAEVKQPPKESAKVEAAQPPKESAKAAVNPHPIADVRLDKEGWALHCTVNGEPTSISFAKEREALPEFAADFALADVTGDGVDELLVRVAIVGNTFSEMLSDGHVYEVKGGELVEALSIPANGFGRWQPKYPNNLGICPGPDGTLAIDVAGGKFDDGFGTFLLVRQGGEWVAKDAPKGFECSGEDAPASGDAPAAAAMDDEQFAELCEKGTAQQVQQALKDGASPSARKYFDWGSMPALTLAAQAGNLPAVQVLLEALRGQDGFEVDEADADVGVTALMAAASGGHAAVVEALLAAGANPKRKDADGHDALWHAQNAGEGVSKEAKTACVKLLQGGAKKPAASAPQEAAKAETLQGKDAGNSATKELRENPQGECLVVTGKNAALNDWRKDKGKVLERREQGTILNLVADEDSHQGDWFEVYQVYENGSMAYLSEVLQGGNYFIRKKDVKRVDCPAD